MKFPGLRNSYNIEALYRNYYNYLFKPVRRDYGTDFPDDLLQDKKKHHRDFVLPEYQKRNFINK
ncbi:hypothetical protein [Chryseobacterium sp. 2VB]|uniref:hypothetical protein n=1 Tax=Chryseobacterium sp. 2VB TaxID=2502204 RepID=UPI000D71979F|nr:hypothetical protein [Chryseobacterium sp. 2VB]